MLSAPKRFHWIYILPFIHFCACLTSMIGLVVPRLQYLGIVWSFIMLADLPISLVAYALAWEHSLPAALWIVVAGTLWWYLLSCGAEFVFGRFKGRQVVP